MRDYRHVNGFVLLAAAGIFPVLCLSSEEVRALTVDDLDILTNDLGMTEDLLHTLRALATRPGVHLRCDFETQRVVVVDPATGEPVP